MTRIARVTVGALLGLVGCVSLVAAQGPLNASPTDWLGIVGFGSGGGALIAWGVQTEKSRSHSRRLDNLEKDRVTRDEHMEMKQDIRQIRDMMERRLRPRD